MKLFRSRNWYEKKAKLEDGCSIAAGRFPSEIFDQKVNLKVISKSKSGTIAAAKPAAAAHKVRRSR